MPSSRYDIGSVPGLPIRGVIRKTDLAKGIAYISLPLTQSGTLFPVKIPVGWAGPRGQISGGYPQRGTSIFVVLGQGNEWIFVSYDRPDSTGNYDGDGTRRISPTAKLKEGRWVTLVERDVGLIVDPKAGVIQGSSTQFTQADPGLGLWSSRFGSEMHFTEGHREITGVLKRDVNANSSRNVAGSSLYGHSYDNGLREIGLDPKTGTSVSLASNRNPALTESRAMYYEFTSSFGYTNDQAEERLYAGEDPPEIKPYQRKQSRTDTLSLSLDLPNFLAETIIGTVVDLYGNILDLNRNVLPSGIIDNLSFRKSEADKNVVFAKLREQLRKSIAYHFEINARKEGLSEPDYADTSDYARKRSRFSMDVDKEGQFKINVPSSSETGNIGLLVRAENFSNIKGFENDTDRGQFLRNVTNNTDIQLEAHGKGVVELKSNEESLKSFAAPINRTDGSSIKLGTGFHELSNVLQLHKFTRPYEGNAGYSQSLINEIPPVQEIISNEVIVAGEGANAGGRSGTVSLDGMLSISIGANTVDRQSLWLDCAGGIVGAIGRDRFQRSVAASLDGDLYLQVGGHELTDDSRFPPLTPDNKPRDGVIDIRVWNSGSFHTIRIDPQGMKIHTPQRLDVVSEGEMRFKSVNSNIYLDAESIFFYNKDEGTSRLLLKATKGVVGSTI